MAVAAGPATNYIFVYILLGLIAFLGSIVGSLFLYAISSNKGQLKKANKLLRKVQSKQITPVEITISDFPHESRRQVLKMAVDMGLSLYKVGSKTVFIGHDENSGVHEHDRWHYIVKAQGINNHYFRVVNGNVEPTTQHYITLEEDHKMVEAAKSYLINQGNNIDLPEVTRMAKLCKQTHNMAPESVADAVLKVRKAGLSAKEIHDLKHHFEEATLIQPELHNYKQIPQELALQLCNLSMDDVNQCPQSSTVASKR